MQKQDPGRAVPVDRSLHRTGLLAELVTLWEPALEQPFPNGLYPMEMLHAETALEELKPVGSAPIGEVCKGLGVMKGTC